MNCDRQRNDIKVGMKSEIRENRLGYFSAYCSCMYCSLKTEDIYIIQNHHYQYVDVIFKQKPVFLKIFNAAIYMYPLKERT